MSKVRLYPHRRADPASARFGEWWIARSGTKAHLPSLLPGWDYASEELIGISLNANIEDLLSSTGHVSLEDLEVVLVADCALAQRRIVARHSLAALQAFEDSHFELVLPAMQLAGSIKLTAHLTVARNFSSESPRVACVRGARLLSSAPRTIALEGEAARFPTEPAAFTELRLADAPWTLHTTFHDLNANFMGGVRLLVNTEHPVGQMLLSSATADRVSGLAMADVLRLLVGILAGREQIDEATFEEETIGGVVDSMCDFFLGHGIVAAMQLYKNDPVHFDRLVHERVRPLSKVFE